MIHQWSIDFPKHDLYFMNRLYALNCILFGVLHETVVYVCNKSVSQQSENRFGTIEVLEMYNVQSEIYQKHPSPHHTTNRIFIRLDLLSAAKF